MEPTSLTAAVRRFEEVCGYTPTGRWAKNIDWLEEKVAEKQHEDLQRRQMQGAERERAKKSEWERMAEKHAGKQDILDTIQIGKQGA